MTKLSVNVNKIATLRNTRHIGIPSVVHFARLALDAGAFGITVHPRPDQRHIRPRDVEEVAKVLKHYPAAEFNIEGNPFYEYLKYAEEFRPTQCTLVPDAPEASTSDHGWEMADVDRLKPIVQRLRAIGCRVSLFMNPNPELMELAKKVGADRVELYTAPYAEEFAKGNPKAADDYAASAKRATELGLGINAGHDLSLQNLAPFLQAVPGVLEVSIGHALVSDALEFGFADTVRRYLATILTAAL
jgi:pyridoxine 5-phosphate synthase